MSLSDRHLSSVLLSFSTFLTKLSISEPEKGAARKLLQSFLASKSNANSWNMTEVDRFASLHQVYQPAVISVVRQFIEKHPPFQVSTYVHEFLLALAADGCSSSTVRNYRSDINQFWLFAQTTDIDPLLNKTKISDFIANEQAKGLQSSSIRRKIAAITQFGLWAQRNSLTKSDLAWLSNPHLLEELQPVDNSPSPSRISATSQPTPSTNVLPSLASLSTVTQRNPAPASLPVPTPIHPTARKSQEYRAQLRLKLDELSNRIRKQSQQLITPWLTIAAIGLFFVGLTIFGYQQLFLDAPKPLAYPGTPVTPNRVLSFQGRLTDTAQNPLTSATNMTFKLFDAVSSGTELWNSGTCSITPDQDGIFNAALGSTCGSAIAATVFSERANVWLEVTVAAETLSPRQPIWTVPYALNSETIQGYPINASGSATVNTVMTMDAAGDVVLGEVGPEIRSVSGQFTITGQSLLLQTQSNGNIILDANGTGGTFVRDYLSAPAATLSATYAAGVPLTVRGGPSGTGNVLDFQNSAGTGLTSFDSAGNLAIGATTTAVKLTVRDTANSSTLGASNSLRLYGATILGARTELGFGYAGGTNVPAVIGYVNADGTSNTNGDLYFGTRSVTSDTAVTERMRIAASGNVGIGGDTTPDSLFSVGSTSQFQVNSSGAVAAATGLTSSGTITFSGLNTAGGVVYTDTSGVLGTVAGSTGQCLTSNGSSAPSWAACSGGAGSSKWNITAGALVPVNTTLDLLLGGTATASARAGFLNINSGTPTASVSAGTAGGTFLTADGNLSTTARQTLTIGNSSTFNTTGNTVINPNGVGNVGIGTTTPGWTLDVAGNGSIANNLLTQIEGGQLYGRTIVSQNKLAINTTSFGVSWTSRDSSRSWTDTAMSADGSYQTATVYGGTLYTSTDYGVTWTSRDSSRNWSSITISTDGKYQTASVDGGTLYTSTDYGVTWTSRDSSRNWESVAMSSDGKYQNAAVFNGTLYTSTDYGVTWTSRDSSRVWAGVAISSDGKYQTATVNTGTLYTSTDYGVTWTSRDSSRIWDSVAMSSDGKYQTATVNTGTLYTSTDYGVTWTSRDSSRAWRGVAISADGRYQTAGVDGGTLYSSTNYGQTWVSRDSSRNWRGIAMSTDGSYQTAAAASGTLYTSNAATHLTGGELIVNTLNGGDIFTASASGTTRFLIDTTGQVIVGGTTPAAAKFAVLNVASGTPTASVSAGTAGGAYLTATGTLQSTANQALTIGGNTTGDITLSPLNGSGRTNNTSDFNLSTGKAYLINGTSVLNATTLGTSVVTSSLTTVGALNAGSITSGFGTIDNADTITGTTLNGTTGINTGVGAGTQRINASGNLVNIGSITASSTITFSGLNTAGGIVYTDSSGVLGTVAGSAGQCLTSNGSSAPSWGSCAAGATNYWRLANGAFSTVNDTADLLVGSNASASAKFAILNVNSGTPTASVSAGIAGGTFLTANGSLSTTARQTLTIGNSATYNTSGNILINSNGVGLVGIGTTNPGWTLDVAGSGSIGNNVLTQIEGGQLYGRTIVSQNKFGLDDTSFGVTWTARDSSRVWRGVAMSANGKYQTAGVDGGTLYTSTDYGVTWTTRDSVRSWYGVAMSADGKYQTATVFNGTLYTSTDYGVTWTTRDSSRAWTTVAMSADGKYQTAAVFSGTLYTSTDYGVTWTTRATSLSWLGIAMSADGKYQTASAYGGTLYTSTDYGVTWTTRDSSRLWYEIAMSSDGKYQTAAVSGGTLYTSTDYGVTWTTRDSARNWYGVAMSADGKYQTTSVSGGTLYTSTDYGVTWTTRDSAHSWRDVAMSADGTYQTAIANSANIHTSNAATHLTGGELIVNTLNGGDIFTASASGTTRFRIDTSGQVLASQFSDLQNATYYLDPAGSTSLIVAGSVGIGGDTTPDSLFSVGSTSQFQVNTNGEVAAIDGVAHTIFDTAGNLEINSNGTKTIFTDDIQVTGNDILDSGATSRINLGATTTLTNTTLTLSGTSTVTASSLATLTTAASLSMGSTTTMTLGSNSTINGGAAANDDITIQGTSNATRTSSYVLLQPTAGNVGIGGDLTPDSLFSVGTTSQFQVNTNGEVAALDGVAHTMFDTSGNLEINSNGTKTIFTDDIQVTGNDILDSGATSRVSLGATTTLTNTTLTLSGTSTVTASSLATLTTAASLSMGSTTTMTLGSNSTINGGAAANDDITIQGTSNATRTTSYVLLQPTSGNVGVGGDLTPDSLFSVGTTSQFQVNSSGAITAATGITSTNTITGGHLTITNDTGGITVGRQDNTNEGGEISFTGAASYDGWTFDVYQNTARMFSNSANTNIFQLFNNSTGVANLDVEGYIEAKVGTSSAPSFTFDSDPNTGIYSASADLVQFTAGGSNAVNINNYGVKLIDVTDGHTCDATYVGTLIYDRDAAAEGMLMFCRQAAGGGYGWRKYDTNTAGTPDLAEYAWTDDLSLDGGDIVAVTNPTENRDNFYDRFNIIRAVSTSGPKMLGVVSSDPSLILNKPESAVTGETIDPRLKPLTLAGRVPVKIIADTQLQQGDRIGLSPEIPGVGSKLWGSGFTVGTVLTAFNPMSATCANITDPAQANWSNTDKDVCFRLPDGRVLAKVLVLVNNEFSIGDSDLAAALKNGQNWNLNTLGELNFQSASPTTYQVATPTGSLVTDLAAYAEAVIGNLRVGFITAQNIVTTRLTATQKIETPELATNMISPIGTSDLTIKLNSTTASTSATAVTITNEQNQVVTKIDGNGNITLAGQLLADQIAATSINATTVTTATFSAQTADLTSARITQLESNLASLEKVRATTAEIVTATISGTLYADEIYNFQDKVATALQEPSLLAQLLGQVPPASSSTSVATLTQFVDQTAAFASGSATLNKSLADLNLGEQDVVLGSAALFINNYFELNGSGYIADSLGIGNSLLVGQGTTIADGRIEYISSSNPSTTLLQIQPSGFGQINFLAGLMTLSDAGQVVINGDLEVAGTLKTKTLLTNLVTTADFTNPFQVQVAGVSTESATVQESRFEIINELGTPVATISAQGRAEFAGGIGIGTEDITGALGEPTTTKTSGKAMVLAGTSEVTIKSPLLTEKSLLYVTPVGSTGNQVLYVKSQVIDDPITPENEGTFVVGFDGQTAQNVQFNWWIVN